MASPGDLSQRVRFVRSENECLWVPLGGLGLRRVQLLKQRSLQFPGGGVANRSHPLLGSGVTLYIWVCVSVYTRVNSNGRVLDECFIYQAMSHMC